MSDAAVSVCHAGALKAVLAEELGPAFTAATGHPLAPVAGQSLRLADEVRRGEIVPDVMLSADAATTALLMECSGAGALVSWQVSFAGNRMALVYQPHSRFRDNLAAAAAGERPWYDVLQIPGLCFKRNDPRPDPDGYRVLFLFQLAEQCVGPPGLAARILREEANEGQLLRGGYGDLRAGRIDVVATYETIARDCNLPVIPLPDIVNLGEPSLHAWYAKAQYTDPLGRTFTGAPIQFTAAIPRSTTNPEGAEAFVRFLLGSTAQAALRRRGFLPAIPCLDGNAGELPASLRRSVCLAEPHAHRASPAP